MELPLNSFITMTVNSGFKGKSLKQWGWQLSLASGSAINQIPQTTVTDRQPQNMHNYSQLTAHFPALVNNFHHWKMNEYHAFSRILHFISHINWQILHKLIINLPNWLTLHIPNTVRLNKLRIYRMGIKQTCSMKMTNSYWSQS